MNNQEVRELIRVDIRTIKSLGSKRNYVNPKGPNAQKHKNSHWCSRTCSGGAVTARCEAMTSEKGMKESDAMLVSLAQKD